MSRDDKAPMRLDMLYGANTLDFTFDDVCGDVMLGKPFMLGKPQSEYIQCVYCRRSQVPVPDGRCLGCGASLPLEGR